MAVFPYISYVPFLKAGTIFVVKVNSTGYWSVLFKPAWLYLCWIYHLLPHIMVDLLLCLVLCIIKHHQHPLYIILLSKGTVAFLVFNISFKHLFVVVSWLHLATMICLESCVTGIVEYFMRNCECSI